MCDGGATQMIPAIEDRGEELRRLCVRYKVQRLDLFGSATTRKNSSKVNDLDLVVEFQPAAFDAYSESYFGLLEALEQLFESPVDLVVGSAIKNPYFLQSVEETRVPVYEA